MNASILSSKQICWSLLICASNAAYKFSPRTSSCKNVSAIPKMSSRCWTPYKSRQESHYHWHMYDTERVGLSSFDSVHMENHVETSVMYFLLLHSIGSKWIKRHQQRLRHAIFGRNFCVSRALFGEAVPDSLFLYTNWFDRTEAKRISVGTTSNGHSHYETITTTT